MEEPVLEYGEYKYTQWRSSVVRILRPNQVVIFSLHILLSDFYLKLWGRLGGGEPGRGIGTDCLQECRKIPQLLVLEGRFWVRTGRLEQEVRELWMKDRQVLMDWKRE